MGTQRPAARNPIISEDRATPSQATGWAAVEKTLTDYDREEIGNYKEDMDTLLVFTGLYSAVLAAFVVVSYTQLQEDTAAESLKALRTLTQQTAVGCTILDGHPVNSTAVPASPLPLFQPSVAAIRVNVLWFASLVVSLSTASFAILVKQWLRAYLAFTSSSPQGQLRVRQFRREGLKVWKVFAIASILPVLLQVSLALFFIGLCFFSSNINPTLGDTIVPLVCAWAFLIISVTVSPVFSARCPYKTPALSSITTALRIRVWLPTAAIAMPWVWRLTAGVVRAICTIILILASTLFVGVVIILDALPFGPKTFGKAFVASVGLVDDKLQALSCSDWTTPQEEAEVLTDNSKDLSILAAADDFQANAELDLVTMKHALEHSKPTWDETVGFLVQVIGNRVPLPTPFSEGPKGSLVDFNLLSIRTKAAISELFDCYVMSRLPADAESKGPLSDSTSTAGAWAAFILFSMYPSYAHIPPKILILSVDSWLDRVTDTGRRIDLPSMPVVLRCIVQDCDELQLLYKVELVTRVINRPAIMSSDDGNEVDPSLSTALRHAAFRLARGLERHLQDASYSLDNAWTLTHRQTISLLFNMCGASHRYSHRIDCGELMGNVLDLLLSQGTHRGVRDCIVSWMAQPSPFVLKDTWNLALRIFSMRRASDYTALATTVIKVAKLARSQDREPAQLLNLGLITLWMMKIEILADQEIQREPSSSSSSPHDQLLAVPGPSFQSSPGVSTEILLPPRPQSDNPTPVDTPNTSNNALWRQALLYIARALELNPSVPSDPQVKAHRNIALACWNEVDIALPPTPYGTDFKEKDAPIPDYFCLVLDTYHAHSGGWQAKRLRLKSRKERLAIIDDAKREIGWTLGPNAATQHGLSAPVNIMATPL